MSDSEIQPGGAPPPQPNTLSARAASSFVRGTPLYPTAAGTIGPAKADSSTTARCVGLALEPGVSGERTPYRFCGPVTLSEAEWTAVLNTGTLLTPGAQYYISQATAGKITATAPGSGILSVAGIAISTTCLLVLPNSHSFSS